MDGEWFELFGRGEANLLSLENIGKGEQIEIEAYSSLWRAPNPLSIVNKSMPIRLKVLARSTP